MYSRTCTIKTGHSNVCTVTILWLATKRVLQVEFPVLVNAHLVEVFTELLL